MVTYWQYYSEFFKVHPGSRTLMLFRTPVTPLFFGALFDWFGSTGVQVVLSILYVLCLLAVWAIGAKLSVWVGFLSLILLGADIQYFYWFFSVGSESPQSFLVVLWAAYAFFTFRCVKPRYWIVHAAIVWLLILNRPGNQVMVLCALFPLLNMQVVWKRRLLLFLVFLLSYGSCHVSYSLFNYLRVGSFQISTLGNAHMPFYRLYLQDALISPDNGPRSREFEHLVEKNILSLEEFENYRINKDIFFNIPTQRMYNHIVQTVADVYGWDHQWLLLRQVSVESFLRHPGEFFLTYLDHLRDVFYVRGDGRFDLSRHNRTRPDYKTFLKKRYELYGQLGLPLPSEGDLLPAPPKRAPQKSIEDYTAKTLWGLKAAPSAWTFPDLRCTYHWGDIFDIYGVKFPFTFLFIIIGIIGTVFSMMRKTTADFLAISSIFSVSFLTLAATLMGSVQQPFRFPFDSVFILLGCFGLHGMLRPLTNHSLQSMVDG